MDLGDLLILSSLIPFCPLLVRAALDLRWVTHAAKDHEKLPVMTKVMGRE
jgi:hypothetical protein